MCTVNRKKGGKYIYYIILLLRLPHHIEFSLLLFFFALNNCLAPARSFLVVSVCLSVCLGLHAVLSKEQFVAKFSQEGVPHLH